MFDLDICICGDYRKNHENGLGKCLICAWRHSENCQEFVPSQFKLTSQEIVPKKRQTYFKRVYTGIKKVRRF